MLCPSEYQVYSQFDFPLAPVLASPFVGLRQVSLGAAHTVILEELIPADTLQITAGPFPHCFCFAPEQKPKNELTAGMGGGWASWLGPRHGGLLSVRANILATKVEGQQLHCQFFLQDTLPPPIIPLLR